MSMCLHNKNYNCIPIYFIVGNPTVNYYIDSVYIANSLLSTPSHLIQRSTWAIVIRLGWPLFFADTKFKMATRANNIILLAEFSNSIVRKLQSGLNLIWCEWSFVGLNKVYAFCADQKHRRLQLQNKDNIGT